MLCLLSSTASLAVSVSLRESLLLLAVAVFAVVGLVTLCRYIVECLSSLFDRCCDQLELWLVARRTRHTAPPSTPPVTNLQDENKNSYVHSPTPAITRKRPLGAHRHLRVVSAQDALRRSCQDQPS